MNFGKLIVTTKQEELLSELWVSLGAPSKFVLETYRETPSQMLIVVIIYPDDDCQEYQTGQLILNLGT